MRLSYKLHASGLVLVCVVICLLFPQLVSAISPEQRRVIDSGARYFNLEESSVCTSTTGSGGASQGVPKNFSLGNEPAERRVGLIKALVADYGFTPEQASGVVGNFMAESGGAHLPPNVNEGGEAGPPKFIGGYGWAQWTGGRQRAFIDYSVEFDYMPNQNTDATDAANYAYLKKELAESYQSTITELKKQVSPEDAAVSFEATFERAGVKVLERRMANARQAFTEYTNSPGFVPGSSCAPDGYAAIIGENAFPLIGTKTIVKNPNIFSNGTTNTAGHPYTAYDILANPGTPVAAFMAGRVVRISTDKCPGRLLSVYNEEANITVSYLHLDFNTSVSDGDTVTVGQQIGLVGSAAQGCGVPHLHIDAATGATRPGCARESCSDGNKAKFIDIGRALYETYQALAD